MTFFFTDSAYLEDQGEDQAYGPVPGQAQTQYRVNSLHSIDATAQGTPYLYAVCKGQILAVEGEEEGTLNIILRLH